MNLYLEANSEIGYTPDWVEVTFDDKGKQFILTMDIRGEINYNPNKLSCRVKGYLDPWSLIDYENGEEKDLSELTDEAEIEKYNKMFLKGLRTIKNVRIGLYPVPDAQSLSDTELEELDRKITDTQGLYEYTDENGKFQSVQFTFECEDTLLL